MPFKKTGPDSYTSPSGRRYNGAQVRMYYANGGKFPSHEEGGSVMAFPLTPGGKKVIPAQPAPSGGETNPTYAKGGDIRVASYANGGPVLGREKDFLKTPDRFRDSGRGTFMSGKELDPKTEDVFPKSGKGEKGKGKSLPAVKPHK